MVFGACREAASERGRWTEHKRTPTGRVLPETSTGDLTTCVLKYETKDLTQIPSNVLVGLEQLRPGCMNVVRRREVGAESSGG